MMDSKTRARQREVATAGKPTKPMLTFLDGLLITCGFSERVQRYAFLSRTVARPIKYLDELTFPECSMLLDVLQETRDSRRASPRDEDYED